jgi:hypothetical protein
VASSTTRRLHRHGPSSRMSWSSRAMRGTRAARAIQRSVSAPRQRWVAGVAALRTRTTSGPLDPCAEDANHQRSAEPGGAVASISARRRLDWPFHPDVRPLRWTEAAFGVCCRPGGRVSGGVPYPGPAVGVLGHWYATVAARPPRGGQAGLRNGQRLLGGFGKAFTRRLRLCQVPNPRNMTILCRSGLLEVQSHRKANEAAR